MATAAVLLVAKDGRGQRRQRRSFGSCMLHCCGRCAGDGRCSPYFTKYGRWSLYFPICGRWSPYLPLLCLADPYTSVRLACIQIWEVIPTLAYASHACVQELLTVLMASLVLGDVLTAYNLAGLALCLFGIGLYARLKPTAKPRGAH